MFCNNSSSLIENKNSIHLKNNFYYSSSPLVSLLIRNPIPFISPSSSTSSLKKQNNEEFLEESKEQQPQSSQTPQQNSSLLLFQQPTQQQQQYLNLNLKYLNPIPEEALHRTLPPPKLLWIFSSAMKKSDRLVTFPPVLDILNRCQMLVDLLFEYQQNYQADLAFGMDFQNRLRNQLTYQKSCIELLIQKSPETDFKLTNTPLKWYHVMSISSNGKNLNQSDSQNAANQEHTNCLYDEDEEDGDSDSDSQDESSSEFEEDHSNSVFEESSEEEEEVSDTYIVSSGNNKQFAMEEETSQTQTQQTNDILHHEKKDNKPKDKKKAICQSQVNYEKQKKTLKQLKLEEQLQKSKLNQNDYKLQLEDDPYGANNAAMLEKIRTKDFKNNLLQMERSSYEMEVEFAFRRVYLLQGFLFGLQTLYNEKIKAKYQDQCAFFEVMAYTVNHLNENENENSNQNSTIIDETDQLEQGYDKLLKKITKFQKQLALEKYSLQVAQQTASQLFNLDELRNAKEHFQTQLEAQMKEANRCGLGDLNTNEWLGRYTRNAQTKAKINQLTCAIWWIQENTYMKKFGEEQGLFSIFNNVQIQLMEQFLNPSKVLEQQAETLEEISKPVHASTLKAFVGMQMKLAVLFLQKSLADFGHLHLIIENKQPQDSNYTYNYDCTQQYQRFIERVIATKNYFTSTNEGQQFAKCWQELLWNVHMLFFAHQLNGQCVFNFERTFLHLLDLIKVPISDTNQQFSFWISQLQHEPNLFMIRFGRMIVRLFLYTNFQSKKRHNADSKKSLKDYLFDTVWDLYPQACQHHKLLLKKLYKLDENTSSPHSLRLFCEMEADNRKGFLCKRPLINPFKDLNYLQSLLRDQLLNALVENTGRMFIEGIMTTREDMTFTEQMITNARRDRLNGNPYARIEYAYRWLENRTNKSAAENTFIELELDFITSDYKQFIKTTLPTCSTVMDNKTSIMDNKQNQNNEELTELITTEQMNREEIKQSKRTAILSEHNKIVRIWHCLLNELEFFLLESYPDIYHKIYSDKLTPLAYYLRTVIKRRVSDMVVVKSEAELELASHQNNQRNHPEKIDCCLKLTKYDQSVYDFLKSKSIQTKKSDDQIINQNEKNVNQAKKICSIKDEENSIQAQISSTQEKKPEKKIITKSYEESLFKEFGEKYIDETLLKIDNESKQSYEDARLLLLNDLLRSCVDARHIGFRKNKYVATCSLDEEVPFIRGFQDFIMKKYDLLIQYTKIQQEPVKPFYCTAEEDQKYRNHHCYLVTDICRNKSLKKEGEVLNQRLQVEIKEENKENEEIKEIKLNQETENNEEDGIEISMIWFLQRCRRSKKCMQNVHMKHIQTIYQAYQRSYSLVWNENVQTSNSILDENQMKERKEWEYLLACDRQFNLNQNSENLRMSRKKYEKLQEKNRLLPPSERVKELDYKKENMEFKLKYKDSNEYKYKTREESFLAATRNPLNRGRQLYLRLLYSQYDPDQMYQLIREIELCTDPRTMHWLNLATTANKNELYALIEKLKSANYRRHLPPPPPPTKKVKKCNNDFEQNEEKYNNNSNSIYVCYPPQKQKQPQPQPQPQSQQQLQLQYDIKEEQSETSPLPSIKIETIDSSSSNQQEQQIKQESSKSLAASQQQQSQSPFPSFQSSSFSECSICKRNNSICLMCIITKPYNKQCIQQE